jgi:hypothetical protein
VGRLTVNETSKKEDEWQRRATAAAIAGARKITLANKSLTMAHVGRLNDTEWGWIVTAAIFGWIETRCEQAIAEGLEQAKAVRLTGLTPSPCDVAVVSSILPTLADTAGIDWALPLNAWSKDTMVNFLLLAWQLIEQAEIARDRGQSKIIRPSKNSDWDKEGDAIPFGLGGSS